MAIEGNPNCERCELHRGVTTVCLMGHGPVPCDVMVIGEAPGRQEDRTGIPFFGQSGDLLTSELEDNGLTRKNVYITNVAKCRPPKNRTPRAKEVDACREYLLKEFAQVKPKFVLLLGRTALRAIPDWKRAKITEIRGQAKLVEILPGIKAYVMATFHPAACLGGRDTGREKRRPMFNVDIGNFARLVRAGKPILHQTNIRIVRSAEDFNEMVNEGRNETVISYDLETDGLNPHIASNGIITVGLGFRSTQWCIPISHPRGPFRTPESRRIAMQCLGDLLKGKLVVTHNGKFDCSWAFVHYGVVIRMGFDTMLAHYLLDENSPHGLKYLAGLYFQSSNYQLSGMDKPGWWNIHSLKRVAKYNCEDVFYTRKLYFTLKKRLEADKRLSAYYYKVLLPAFQLFVKIEANGIHVDWTTFEKSNLKVAEDFGKACFELNRIKPNVLWSSPKQVAKVLYDWLKFPLLAKTKKGQPSTSESTLKLLKFDEDNKKKVKIFRKIPDDRIKIFAKMPLQEGETLVRRLWFYDEKRKIPSFILDWRAARKMSEFIKSWKTKAGLAFDGRLHPIFKFLVVTGRLSCSEPNIQQTPRDPVIRSCVTAPPGFVFVEVDASQVELRFAAMLSGDETMKRIFQTGGDIHRATAADTARVPEEEVTQEQRKAAKAVNFGFIYGMGWRKFQKYAKDKYNTVFTDEQAQEVRDIFFRKYSALQGWHRKQRNKAKRDGFVRGLLGQIRHLPDVFSDDEELAAAAERQAINTVVQGPASQMNLVALLGLVKDLEYGLKGAFTWDEVKPVATVHDSILMWIREDLVVTALPRIKEILEHPPIFDEMDIHMTVPMVYDVKVGPWGSGVEVNPGKWDNKKALRRDLKAINKKYPNIARVINPEVS